MTDYEFRWQLYANWQHSAPAVQEQRKNEYSQHLAACVVCKANLAERRHGEPNPDRTISEIEES